MHSTFAKRGQFAEPIIDSYCDTIASRMRGQIRSAVVAPIVSRISKPIFEAIEQEIVTNVLYPDRLEQQFLLENYRRAGFVGIGVAAGDYDEKDTGNLSDEDEEERWNLNQPAWYNADDSEFLSSVQIAQDNRRSSVTSNQDQNPVILQHNRSRVMFDGRGNPAVDRFIETVFSVFREKFNESQKESIRHRNISSSDLFTSNNQEINRDVAAIRRGKGPAIFKAFNEFNATTFGTTRYLLEQVSHIAHLTAPDGKAIIDASLGTVGHGINELWIKLPDKYTNFIENNYQDFMGSNFPTRNLSFAVEFPASLLVGQMGGSVLKLSLKPKTNSSAVTPMSKRIDTPAIEYTGGAKSFAVDYKNFTTTQWTAPSGTRQTYKVHQRHDIDWNMVRTNSDGPKKFLGKTNRDAALAGKPPELADGSFVNLHHIGQNSKGPLVEASTKHHTFGTKSFKSLHNQYGINKGHPEFPVDHGNKWRNDVSNYWKNRGQNE